MKTAVSKPFLVSSGAKSLTDRYGSFRKSNKEEGTPVPRPVSVTRRSGISGGPRTSARSITASAPRRSRNGSEVPRTMAGLVIPEVGRPQKQLENGTVGAAPPTATRAAPGQCTGGANVVNRRRSTAVEGVAGNLSRRGSTAKDVVRQYVKQQQKYDVQKLAKPAGSSEHVEGGRQQQRRARRDRVLNLGLTGNFFGARQKRAQDLFRGIPTLPGLQSLLSTLYLPGDHIGTRGASAGTFCQVPWTRKFVTGHPLCSDGDSVSTGGNGLWAGPSGSEHDFLLSRHVDKVDWFVSHTWARDRRDKMIRTSTELAELKAAELKKALEDIALEKRAIKKESVASSRLEELMMKVPAEPLVLWIDKFCVSPDILERRLVVERHMDHFLTNSDGLLVLLSSCYFRRLWCVYEWGAFVAAHGTGTLDRIRVCLSWICCSANFQIPILANDIETLCVTGLKCSELSDQLYLRSVTATKYLSVQAFVRMVQISALCALAKSYAILASDFCTAGHRSLEEAWRVFDRHLRWRHAKFLLPWRSVAERLGLPSVCSGLDNFWDQMQRSTKISAEGAQLDDGSDMYCVSAPPRNRLRIFANSAAQMYLAVLVRKARAAAVIVEGVAGAAMTLSALAARDSTGAAAAAAAARGAPRNGSAKRTHQLDGRRAGAVRHQRVDGIAEDDGSGSDSSESEEFIRENSLLTDASETRR